MSFAADVVPFTPAGVIGASDAARVLDETREELVLEYRVLRSPSKEPVARELARLSIDYNLLESAEGRSCARQALQFLIVLPSWASPPELALDPDGEVAFDWAVGNDMISVSVGPTGRVIYVWAVGGDKGSNTGGFVNGLPDDLLKALQQIV